MPLTPALSLCLRRYVPPEILRDPQHADAVRNYRLRLSCHCPAASPPPLNSLSVARGSVDVYAFGIMMYEVLHCGPAYGPAMNDYQIAESVCTRGHPDCVAVCLPAGCSLSLLFCAGARPDLYALNAPDWVKNLCYNCWAESQSQRPPFKDILVTLTQNFQAL